MKYSSILKYTLLGFLILCVGVSLSEAKAVRSANTEAELVSTVKTIQAGEPFWVALHMKMDDKWHIYWKNPGDAGIPPRIEWSLPEGYEAGPMQWPFPHLIKMEPLMNYGYEGDVYFPVLITPPDDLGDSKFIELQAHATWLACEIQCVPGEADLSLIVQKGEGPPQIDTFYSTVLKQTWLDLPMEQSGWEITADSYEDYFVIKLFPTYALLAKNSKAYFFPYQDDIIDHSVKQTFGFKQYQYHLYVKKSSLKSEGPHRLAGVLYSPQGWDDKGERRALKIDVALENVKKK